MVGGWGVAGVSLYSDSVPELSGLLNPRRSVFHSLGPGMAFAGALCSPEPFIFSGCGGAPKSVLLGDDACGETGEQKRQHFLRFSNLLEFFLR